MPGWAHAMRLEQVKPNLDVFSLGKLLWAMVAGRKKLRLWYHAKPEFDLQQLFPGNESVGWVKQILAKTVAEEPEQCLPDAGALLQIIDSTIEALTMRFRIVNGDLLRQCIVCGVSNYHKVVDHNQTQQRNFGLEVISAPKFRIFVCDGCGHAQMFYSADGIRPPVWKA